MRSRDDRKPPTGEDRRRGRRGSVAQAFNGAQAASGAPLLVRTRYNVWGLRLTLGSIALLGAVLFLLGTSWDIQWHTFIGRDRTLVPPPQVLLAGAHLATRAGAAGAARLGYAGALVGLAAMMGTLLLFLDAAFGRMHLSLFGGLPLNIFPVMCGGFGAFPLAIAARAHPWR